MADAVAPVAASRKNLGGRPRAAEAGLRLSTYVRESEYDRLMKMAQRRDKSVSQLVADLLRLHLR